MSEFRVEGDEASNRRGDLRLRLILWGAVFALSGIALFTVYGVHSIGRELNSALLWLSALIVLGVILAAHLLSIHRGRVTVKRESVFVLTDTDLLQRRSGHPDVQIGLSQIKALYERPGWLVVESVEPHRRIAIPLQIVGFRSLRAELTKYGPVLTPPRISLMWLVFGTAYILCFGLALWSRDAAVAKVAGLVGIMVFGWGSFLLGRQVRHSTKRLLIWILIGLCWVAATVAIYVQLWTAL